MNITAADLAELLAGLEPIGRSEQGTTRLAWTPEHEQAAAWFEDSAARIGLLSKRSSSRASAGPAVERLCRA